MYRFIIAFLTFSVFVFGATSALAATDAPADLRLTPPETMRAKKTPVDFSHNTHDAADIACATCHHNWDGESEVQSCAASGCHDQPGKRGVNSFYAAFHNKKTEASCLGCHKSLKKQGNKDVPTSCKSCHPR